MHIMALLLGLAIELIRNATENLSSCPREDYGLCFYLGINA